MEPFEMSIDPTTMPACCQPGVEPDRFGLFLELSKMWRTRHGGAAVKQLATHLNVAPQKVSQWCTGSSGTSPAPWFVILQLCEELGLCVVLSPRGSALHKDPAKKASEGETTAAPDGSGTAG